MLQRVMCLAVATGVAAAGGCRSLPPLPAHEWQGSEVALQTLATRAERVSGVAVQCEITVDPPDAGAVTLEGAFAVTEDPPRLRLQAWKFDQSVLDLTATEEGVWLSADERAKDVERFLPEGGGAAPWLGPLLTPLDPAAAEVLSEGDADGTLVARWPLRALLGEGSGAEGWVTLEVDRATLTIREVIFADSEGAVVQRLSLGRYVMLGDVPWPTRLSASGQMELRIKLQETELNPDLPAGAFRPPSHAVKRR